MAGHQLKATTGRLATAGLVPPASCRDEGGAPGFPAATTRVLDGAAASRGGTDQPRRLNGEGRPSVDRALPTGFPDFLQVARSKYRIDDLAPMLDRAGFRVTGQWQENGFALTLADAR